MHRYGSAREFLVKSIIAKRGGRAKKGATEQGGGGFSGKGGVIEGCEKGKKNGGREGSPKKSN